MKVDPARVRTKDRTQLDSGWRFTAVLRLFWGEGK